MASPEAEEEGPASERASSLTLQVAHEVSDTVTGMATARAEEGKLETREGGSAGEKDEGEGRPTTEHEYPEGGLRAYLTVAGGGIALFATFGLANSWGSFQAEFEKNQLKSLSPSSISWIGSSNLCFLFVFGLPAGRAFDAGYFRYLLGGASLLSLLGCYTLSVSREYYQIWLSYAGCIGLAQGLIFSPVASCVGSYFYKRRSVMIGICVTAAAVGAVVFPLILNPLFLSVGFAATIRVTAYVNTGCFVLANALMRPRVLPSRTTPPPPVFPLMRAFLREPATWFISLGVGFSIAAMWVVLFYVQVFVGKHNEGPILSKYCLSILNSTAVVGRLGVGFLADRWGNLNCAIPSSFAIGALTFAMLGATRTGPTVVFLLLFGLACGGMVTVISPSLMTLARSVHELGTRVGLGFLFLGLCTLVGTPIAGAILTAAGGAYWAPCLFASALGLTGTAFLLAARRIMVNRKQTWKV